MIRPDVLVSWPDHVDYPLFRYQLDKYRDYFHNVIICFTPGIKDRNVEDFVRKVVPTAIFVKPTRVYPDWRQSAIMALLQKSNAGWILFMEQDFIVKDKSFYENVLNHSKALQFIGYKEGERIHPAFSLIKTELLYLTQRDFSAYPDKGLDHFGTFFGELEGLTKFTDIREIGLKDREDFLHLAGLTQNYHCFRENQPFFKPDEFLTYNHYIQKLNVPQDQTFMSYCEGIEKAFKNPDNEVVKNFFPVTSL